MQNVSNAFRRALSEDKRDYILRATITLTSGTVLTLDNSYIWEGGFTINDAVSNDNSFQVGGAIINGASLNINNVYGTFDEYDFDNARVVMECGLSKADLETETADEYVKKGVFHVDEATYNDTYIKLSCLDNMAKFDRPYTFDGPNDITLTYPATLGDIVQNACHNCGVTLANDSQQFPHYTYVVDNAPSGQSTTYRQVISWVAQIAGCFARCNADGELEIRWYDILALEAQMQSLDGGYFDGIDINWLADYLNTDTGMTTLQSGTVDDQWFYIENSIGFTFNDTVSSRLYIDSDSCFAFADSAPVSHGHTRCYDVNICCRDGQADLIKYQVIDTESRQAIKVRFHGYTRYGSTYATREYELEYEIFFIDNEEIIINFITLPTVSDYLGESSIIENGVTTTLAPTTESVLVTTRSEDAWDVTHTADHYLSGDTADGGTFDPWNTGDVYDAGTFTDLNNCHFIRSAFTSNISTDDVVITGVKVVKRIKTEGSQDSFIEYTSGTTGYMISIENNDLIQGTHGQDIADWIGDVMTGFTFRKAELSHLSDPSMEAGDVAVYFDRKENAYPIIISSTSFTVGNSQNTHSSAETPRKNSATRYTEATREYVEMRRQLADQQTAWEEAVEDLSERIDNADGLYSTQVVESGATKIYYHNKPILNESDIVMLFTTAGFTMTANYQDTSPTWYGMTVDGTMIAAIMNTIGLNFDWGVGGELIIRDGNNVETLYANAATGVVRINANSLSIQGTSVSDEINASIVNNVSSQWGTSNTASATAVKVVTCANFEGLYAGKKITVKFQYGNTAAGPMLNVNSTGNKRIKANGANISSAGPFNWVDGAVVDFTYDGTDWIMSDSIALSTRPAYGTCDTAASTASKVVTLDGFTLYKGAKISVLFTYANTASNPRLNVNSTGANYIRIRGAAPTAKDYWKANAVVDFIYDGEYWEMCNIESQQEIFNRLTASDNGTQQGIYLDNGKLYLNFEYAQGQTLVLGGSNNTSGLLEVYDGSTPKVKIVTIDNDGIRNGKTSVTDYQNPGFCLNNDGVIVGTGSNYFQALSTGEIHVWDWPYQYGYDTIHTTFDIASIYGTSNFGSIYCYMSGDLDVEGSFTANEKLRVMDTDYGRVSLYCYETPEPSFGDIGEGVIGEDGRCFVEIDPIFSKTINCKQYQVFIQPYCDDRLYVSERNEYYFVVNGQPGSTFGWELKARQIDLKNKRLDPYDIRNDNLPELRDELSVIDPYDWVGDLFEEV